LTNATVTGKELTIGDVQRALIAEEATQNVLNGPTATAFCSSTRPPPTSNTKPRYTRDRDHSSDVCNWCARIGHWESECRARSSGKPHATPERFAKTYTAVVKRKKQHNGNERKDGRGHGGSCNGNGETRAAANATSGNSIVFTAVTSVAAHAATGKFDGFIDSAADEHLILEKTDFVESTLRPIEPLVIGTAARGKVIYGTMRGTAIVRSIIPGKKDPIEVYLTDAVYAPDGQAKLICLGRLIDKGARPEFDSKGTLSIYLGDRLAIYAPKRGQLWGVPSNCGHTENSVVTVARANVGTTQPMTYEFWHQRLGHPSIDYITKLSKIVDGFRLDDPKPAGLTCPGCELGKGHRDPFPDSTTGTSKPFEHIHCDLAGPMRVATVKGGRFALLFIDDYSRTICVDSRAQI